MKRRYLCLLVSLLLTMTACQAEATPPVISELPRVNQPSFSANPGGFAQPSDAETSTPEANTSASDNPLVIFIEGYEEKEDSLTYKLAEVYQQRNPDSAVSVIYAKPLSSITRDTYLKRFKSLNGGKGADIIISSTLFSMLPMMSIDAANEFTDINTLIANDRYFNREDYFTNILDAMVGKKGELNLIPLSVNCDLFAVNKSYEGYLKSPVSQCRTLNVEEILKAYEDIANEKLYVFDYPMDEKMLFMLYENREEGRVEIDLKLLEIYLSSPEMTFETFFAQHRGETEKEEINRFLSSNSDVGNQSVYNYLFEYPESDFTKPLPISSLNGETYFSASSSIAINENSENKELAWEFVKFCMSNPPINDEKTQYAFNTTVNKTEFRQRMAENLETLLQKNRNEHSLRSDITSWEAAEYLYTVYESVTKLDLISTVSRMENTSIIKEYREGTITLESLSKYMFEQIPSIIENSRF